MISLLMLGSGGALPTPDRSPAAYWLEADGRGMLLDPGPGALVRLMRSPHGPDAVDAIRTVLMTHLHPDHCADLVSLLFALRSEVTTSTAPLQLIGPRGLSDYLDRLRDLYGHWITPLRREVPVLEVAPGEALRPGADDPDVWTTAGDRGPSPDSASAAASASITLFAASHGENRFSADNLCLRVADADGATLAYSGDSEPCAGLTAAAAGVDLLVTECSTPDELAVAGHMTPSKVAALCRDARPGRVVLTHLYPPAAALDLAALVGENCPSRIEVGRDGALYHATSASPDA